MSFLVQFCYISEKVTFGFLRFSFSGCLWAAFLLPKGA
nr:MAG TPA: hypothetical protein [Caudoviricetes sp.]DAT92749.1 MAG TPA: hypothetical protein [Caudoviricetes sp.]